MAVSLMTYTMIVANQSRMDFKNKLLDMRYKDGKSDAELNKVAIDT
jgi:hypothetical protein